MSEKDKGRNKNRVRKTLSLPADLVKKIQDEADAHYKGDFTRAAIERFYPEAAEFLRTNETDKHNYKK
jgi:hypothetical protein